jgi:cytochrome c biogenesis protein
LTTVDTTALDPELTSTIDGASGLARFYQRAWRFFCSLRVTVVVLFLLAVGCLVGMFYDQTLTYEEHAAQWAVAAWKLKLFTFLELNDVFHSWWFASVIIGLALNLTACSIERLPKIWIDIQNPQRELADKQLRGIRHRYQNTIADADKATRILAALWPKAVRREHDGVVYYFFEKHRFARTGVYIVHIALLTIMGGAILTTNTGIDGMMMIQEGRNARMVRVYGPGRLPYFHDLGFEVRCNDFRLKTFVDGAPMEFESDLAVYDPNALVNPVVSKTIQVNDPLEYKGYYFYQASYNPIPGDQMVQLDVGPRCGDPQCTTRGKRLTYTAAIGDRITMADGIAYVPLEIIPEFGGLGGAVRVQQLYPDGRQTTFVVFRSYPDFDFSVRRGEHDVQFRGFDQQYATGIQVGRVPFIPIVFGGFLTMFVGMFMAFFMSHRRYWARMKPRPEGGYDLIVAGAARRHQYAFEEEFAKIRELCVAAFGASDTADRARALRDARKAAKSAKES